MSGSPTDPDHRTEVLPDGSIRVPASFVVARGLRAGARVTVRVTERHLSDALQKAGVSEDEIDLIARRQLESRENVIGFLSAEGSIGLRSKSSSRLKRWLSSWK